MLWMLYVCIYVYHDNGTVDVYTNLVNLGILFLFLVSEPYSGYPETDSNATVDVFTVLCRSINCYCHKLWMWIYEYQNCVCE